MGRRWQCVAALGTLKLATCARRTAWPHRAAEFGARSACSARSVVRVHGTSPAVPESRPISFSASFIVAAEGLTFGSLDRPSCCSGKGASSVAEARRELGTASRVCLSKCLLGLYELLPEAFRRRGGGGRAVVVAAAISAAVKSSLASTLAAPLHAVDAREHDSTPQYLRSERRLTGGLCRQTVHFLATIRTPR